MIIYAQGKVIGTDVDGRTQDISAVGIAEEQDELKMSGQLIEGLLLKILKESMKQTMHLSFLTDVDITNMDVEV